MKISFISPRAFYTYRNLYYNDNDMHFELFLTNSFKHLREKLSCFYKENVDNFVRTLYDASDVVFYELFTPLFNAFFGQMDVFIITNIENSNEVDYMELITRLYEDVYNIRINIVCSDEDIEHMIEADDGETVYFGQAEHDMKRYVRLARSVSAGNKLYDPNILLPYAVIKNA